MQFLRAPFYLPVWMLPNANRFLLFTFLVCLSFSFNGKKTHQLPTVCDVMHSRKQHALEHNRETTLEKSSEKSGLYCICDSASCLIHLTECLEHAYVTKDSSKTFLMAG